MTARIEKDWTTASGFRAVVAVMDMGYRCGYVGVPVGHPLHGTEYNAPSRWLTPLAEGDAIGKRGAIPLMIASLSLEDTERMSTPEMVFDVHGSLTYSGGNGYPVESDLWWFGYDCAHWDDAPDPELISGPHRESRLKYARESMGVVRTLAYCADECESLARQIAEKVSP